VVTNTTFTAQAITLAASAGVVLWDREDVVRQLLGTRSVATGHELR